MADVVGIRELKKETKKGLINVLVYIELTVALSVFFFSIVGFSMNVEGTTPLLLLAFLQTAIALPGFLLITVPVPTGSRSPRVYLLLFIVLQLLAFISEFSWGFILLFREDPLSMKGAKCALLFLLTALQAVNVVVATFFRDTQVDLGCCIERYAMKDVEMGRPKSAVPSWARTAPPIDPKSISLDTISESKRDNSSGRATAMKREEEEGTRSPLEKNLFAHVTEEDRQRAIGKHLSRLPVETATPHGGSSSEESAEEGTKGRMERTGKKRRSDEGIEEEAQSVEGEH